MRYDEGRRYDSMGSIRTGPMQLRLIPASHRQSIPVSPDSAAPQLAEPGDREGGLS